LFALKETGHIYSRIGNPTVDVFEQRFGLLEGGTAAVALSSGMAAISFSILNVAGTGDEIVAAGNLYGGTYNLFAHTLPKYGIPVKFVDATNPENFREVITIAFLQGLETLHLRVPKHNENALAVAIYLENHPAGEWVHYNGFAFHPSYKLANKYLKNGFGSIVNFGIKGGQDAGRKIIDCVNLWSHVANVGDAKSLIIHPASTTHQQLSGEELKQTGVTEELIRLSVGLESIEDLVADLSQAIEKATA
jgi:O-acetylhomoserine/O-acetylserine sulfhydrylase-like pyridoxal-dependent enzyme